MEDLSKVYWNEEDLTKLVDNKDSDRISVLKDEWEKRIRETDHNSQVVLDEKNRLDKELVKMRNELSNKRHDYLEIEQKVRKALFLVRELKSQKRQLDDMYWRAK